MSRPAVWHERAVLVLAIAILPWVALSRIGEWRSGGKDVLVYFNNDGGGNAVRNALTLRGLLGDT